MAASPLMFAIEYVKLVEDAILPYQVYRGDAGFDLASYREYKLPPFALVDVSLGIEIKMPPSMYGRITNRSSTQRVWQLEVIQGIIDPSYIGELFVGVRNSRGIEVVVPAGVRLAQIIFSPVICPDFIEVSELGPTARGKRGFGSTGR